MRKVTKSRWAEYIFLLFLLCASLFLFLANLGNQYLWQDEAQTALISKTILRHGIPLGYDGKNYFSQDCGAEFALLADESYYTTARYPYRFYNVTERVQKDP